ncbi:Predicted permease [uncultured Alphaproteobacteria bacterium]|uniref:Predicted permease n=1 Tax=uncultured Alphaproteobacteria bacterium TaxID=91750 RepID=A0A212KLN0_9PROT|nr:Predicted permease [uncultured Alphaproteobacteria bacterium]
MMRGLTRYVLKQLVVGMVLVTCGLTILLWLSQSLRFIDLIVNKGVSAALFLRLTSLLLPGFLMVVLPIAIFTVVLFVYNKLTGDRELVVMQATGMSPWDLSKPALALALAITAMGYVLTLWLAPESVRAFRDLNWTIRQDVTHLVLKEGEFTDVGDGVVVFVGERAADNVLSNILIWDTRNPDREVTVMAEEGALVPGATMPRIHLVNGTRQEYRPSTHEFTMLYFDSYTAEFGDGHGSDEVRFRDARERPLAELFEVQPGPLSESDVRRFRIEGVQRLLLPLQVLGLTLLALYGLLGGRFDRRGQAGRIAVTVALMVGFQAAVLGVNNLAARSLAMLPLLPVLALLPIVLPAWLLYPVRRARVPSGLSSGVSGS